MNYIKFTYILIFILKNEEIKHEKICFVPPFYRTHWCETQFNLSDKLSEFVPQLDLLWKMFIRVLLAFAPQEQCSIRENPANMTGTAHGEIISIKLIRLYESNQTFL
jgi:hypothetical protein